MSISYADMREIVAIQHKGESHKEGEDLDQFIDCMTKIRMEQHTKIEGDVEALLNKLVFPKEMVVEMSKLLSPKKKKIKFNLKKVVEEKWVEKDCPIEENNDDCSVCGIIMTDDDMYSATGKCESCLGEEVEECEKCKIQLRIGSANNPSHHSIFNGCCDDCREGEDEDDEEEDWWYANGGNITFITTTEAKIQEIDADEWGSLYHFNDERKKEE